MRANRAVGMAFCLIGIMGCGTSSPAESAMAEDLAIQEQVATILGNVHDEGSLQAALPDLEKAVDQQSALRQRFATLKITPEEIAKVQAKFEKQSQGVTNRVAAAWITAKSKAPKGDNDIERLMVKLGYETRPNMIPAP